MLEIRLIRENPEAVRNDLRKRGDAEKLRMLEDLIAVDKEWRQVKERAEGLRAERNKASRKVNELKKAGRDASAAIREAAEIPDKIADLEARMEALRHKEDFHLMRLPNILHESVPQGVGEEGNVVVRTWGEANKPAFPVKSHVDLLQLLDVADLGRAANVAGARFYYLKNELVLLDLAIQRFALDILCGKGFTPVYPPFFMHRKPYEGVTDLKDFEDVMYKIEGEDLYLIATSEHPLAAMHMGEIFEEDALPVRYAGVSTCFRKEAGAHGKDTKGIFRVHQFTKVEQFVFCRPEDSWKIHEELIANAEEVFRRLGIPYRVVNICTGDIGTVAAKKYDLEAWMPAQGVYREAVSCSNCTSYQAARLGIRYRKARRFDEKELVHTLNSTAVANPRAMVAILENFQQEDGSVRIPDALVPYMNGVTEIRPRMGRRAEDKTK
ncbi:MAG: serine--tRNA ligase [Candidatus Micrarchaeota archaeon]